MSRVLGYVQERAGAIGRAIALAVIAFCSAELVIGASSISRAASLAPLFLLYGGGVVFIREVARRAGIGLIGVAVLGAAYCLLEEGVTLQSMFSPTLFSAASLGARAFGVNWIWTVWALGYHITYSVLIPIVVAEGLFDDRREEPWLGLFGLIVAAIACLGAATVIGAYFRGHLLSGRPAPLALIAPTALLALALVLLAGPIARGAPRLPSPAAAPPTWLVAVLAFAAAWAWPMLFHLPDALRHLPAAGLTLAVGVMTAVGAGLAVDGASRASGWTATHTAAAVLGLIAPNILNGGYLLRDAAAVDRLGQGTVSAAIVGLVVLSAMRSSIEQRRARGRATRSPSRALVIGAGVAGPVCALFLRRAGFQVDLFETHAAPVGDEGGGLMIAPNGMGVLAKLGLADAVRRAGAETRAMVFGDEFGAPIARIRLGTKQGQGAVTIARAALHGVLLAALGPAGIPVHYRKRLTGLVSGADGKPSATFEDGTRADADIVVGADGLHSAVRAALYPPGEHCARYTGFTNIGGFSTPIDPSMRDEAALRLFFGAKAFFAYVPISDGAQRRIMWWASLAFPDEPGLESLGRRDADALRDRLVADFSPLPGPLPDLVEASSQMMRIAIYDVDRLPHWSAGRIVLIGDAAHAMPPHAGQGASMAMEDAAALVRSLESEAPIERALTRYERARRRRVEVIANAARKNGHDKVPVSAQERRVRARVLGFLAPLIGASIRHQFAGE